jgi:hypothetical protein
MKVYLVYFESISEGRNEPIGVFDSERKALDCVIKEFYSGPFYSGMNPDWLDKNASSYIQEMEVK